MNSQHKKPTIWAFGQRSIAASFRSSSLNPFQQSKEDGQTKDPKNESRLSLSDFLDRKLHKTSALRKTVQGKPMPFSSPLGPKDVGGSIYGQVGVEKERAVEKDCVLDKAVFEQFKHTSVEGKGYCVGSRSVCDVGGTETDGMQESRKRRNPFEGGAEKCVTRKHLIVLGDDPKPKRNGRTASFINNQKPRPLYNHYANGSGWWDHNMEGVDNEEVGAGDGWEGVGSTTLGGIEWH